MTPNYLRPEVGDEVRILRPHNLATLCGYITEKLYDKRRFVWFRIDLGADWTVCLQADDIERTGATRFMEKR